MSKAFWNILTIPDRELGGKGTCRRYYFLAIIKRCALGVRRNRKKLHVNDGPIYGIGSLKTGARPGINLRKEK